MREELRDTLAQLTDLRAGMSPANSLKLAYQTPMPGTMKEIFDDVFRDFRSAFDLEEGF